MIRLEIRTALVVALLGVVAGSGIAAGSASASNTTGVTCVAGLAITGFSDSHCATEASPGTFVHQSFPENTSTGITIVNEGNAATLKTTVSGAEVMVNCTTASGSGILNTQGGAEMYSFGTAKITFTGCTVEHFLGCTIRGETVTTEPLIFTTKGQGMGVQIASELASSVLAEITFENCQGLSGTWPLKGSVVLTPHGATLTSTHAETTTQGTLLWFGTHKTGLTSSLIFKGSTGAAIAWTT